MTSVLITGDRNWTDQAFILDSLKSLRLDLPVTMIHGACRGADLLAAGCCRALGWTPDPHPANWELHGKSAGIVRNIEMLNLKPDIVMAFHDNLSSSRGTFHCLSEAVKRNYKSFLNSHNVPIQRITAFPYCSPCNMSFPNSEMFEVHCRTKYHLSRQTASLYLNRPQAKLFNEDG